MLREYFKMCTTVDVEKVPCIIRTLIQDPHMFLTEYGRGLMKSDLDFRFKKNVWLEIVLYAVLPDNDQVVCGYAKRIVIDEVEGVLRISVGWTTPQKKELYLHPEEYVVAEIQVSSE